MFKLPEEIKKILLTFQKNSFQIYIVGGAIRNLLLDKIPIDWDFTTSAKPEEIQRLFPDNFYDNAYGTVSVKLNKKIFQITPFRKERKYDDFRHPKKISWAKTIEEDLARRDFTINAIAFDGKKLVDPYQGRKHIRQKLIITVGNPDERFKEDALRLMRGIRFASQLGFLIEEKTRKSIKKNSQLILHISWERIRDEFLKILASDHPSEGVLFLHNSSLLKVILPEVEVAFSIPQKSPKRHHIYDVGTHLVMSLKYCPSEDPITRFATLIHDIGKVKTFFKTKEGVITFYNHEVVGAIQTEKIARRLKLSNRQKEKLIKLVRFHQFTVNENQIDKTIRRFIKNVGQEYLKDLLAVRTGDRIGSGAKPTSWRLELFKKRLVEVQKKPFAITDLKINGKDVMKILSLKPGPKIGKTLKKIFDQVVENKLKNQRKLLIEEIKKIA